MAKKSTLDNQSKQNFRKETLKIDSDTYVINYILFIP